MQFKIITSERGNALVVLLLVLILLVVIVGGIAIFFGGKAIISEILESKKLRESLSRLTQEDKIGYAKVIAQEEKNGKLQTTLKFIETARDNELDILLEKEYTIEGDVVHFDAIIVTFDNQLVMDGKERSLYLWRRVYGENMSPSEGYAIETESAEPMRYSDIFKKLSVEDRTTFWTEIWDLANDPNKLNGLGVRAIYGNAVYSKLKPGLVYVFKISSTGQVYPEINRDI